MWCNTTATMAGFRQITICLLLLTLSKNIQGIESETEAKEGREEELVQSESKDGKLEIIKRIKKINEDGTYTIGYEADDGSFKIESRDVLGNIKGTYGFLDEEGQIKRVSYSTSNSSEITTKPESVSVVQRIPNKNKDSSTRRPSATQSTPTTSSSTVIQSIARRRTSTSTTTTQKPNYNDVINMSSRTTTRPPHQITYTSVAPRVLLQNRPSAIPTLAAPPHTTKSEGQLIRPETVTVKPTQLPLFRRFDFKHLDEDKPVNEELETDVKGNILRRQLPQDNTRQYNVQNHIYNYQQSLGQDSTDVYSGSVTTGTPRPLFTTTNKPSSVASTTLPPESGPRPTVRYPINYQRSIPQTLERNNPEYTQETSTAQSTEGLRSTPAPLPVVQIPANREENQEPLVAIRHPFQRTTILVPLSQLQGRLIPAESMREVHVAQNQYDPNSQEQYYRETTPPNVVEIEQQKAVVRRLPPPQLRPIPVQVDENGYIRELNRQVPSPYPIPVPVPVHITPAPKYVDDDIDNGIDNIQPPVSTRDFQKLLQELIVRQSRLEKISSLSKQEVYVQQQQRYRPVYSSPQAYFIQKEPGGRPVQFIQQRPEQGNAQQINPRQFYEAQAEQQQQQQQIGLRPQLRNIYQEQYDAQSYRPNRRVARLLPPRSQDQQNVEEQYLPPDVREMLLLRMLQLAINPALKLEDDNVEILSETSQFKRMPVRNVEILGEEPEPVKRRPEQNKRYRELQKDYE